MWKTQTRHLWRPQLESNQHCRLRGSMSYPLNDGVDKTYYNMICYNVLKEAL